MSYHGILIKKLGKEEKYCSGNYSGWSTKNWPAATQR